MVLKVLSQEETECHEERFAESYQSNIHYLQVVQKIEFRRVLVLPRNNERLNPSDGKIQAGERIPEHVWGRDEVATKRVFRQQ